MRHFFSFALRFLALLSPAICAQGSGMSIGITSFSITPNSFPQGSAAEFSISLNCTGSSVSDVSARIGLYDSAQKFAGSINFRNFKMAGGESQELSQIQEIQNLTPGLYTAYANITYDEKVVSSSPLRFRITPSAFGASGASAPQCSPRTDCGEWSSCEEGYHSQFCVHVPPCAEPDFSKVEQCEKPAGPTLGQLACTFLPSLCTQERKDFGIFLCMPPIAVLILFALYILFFRRRRKL